MLTIDSNISQIQNDKKGRTENVTLYTISKKNNQNETAPESSIDPKKARYNPSTNPTYDMIAPREKTKLTHKI